MTQNNKKSLKCTDWHPWDVKAALGKIGYSLTRVGKENGYNIASPNKALYRPWAAMERIIAAILGMQPWEIWPSRYDIHNQPFLYRKTKKEQALRHKTAHKLHQ